MSFSIKPEKSIRRELRRVVRQQLKQARRHLEPGAGFQLHAARKAVKKARAIVTLLREAKTAGLRKDARRLRTAGRTLSKLRDADAVIDTLGRVSRNAEPPVPEDTLLAIRSHFRHARAQVVADAIADGSVARSAGLLGAVRRAAADWDLPAIDLLELPALVRVAYRSAHKAMRRAERTSRPSDLHSWRKGIKTLWYELRLLNGLVPSLGGTIKELGRLEGLLGEHHDLAVLASAIGTLGPPDADDMRRALSDAARAQQHAVRQEAFRLGRRTLAHKPRVFARALRDALEQRFTAGTE